MQLGTRWPVGDEPPSRLPEVMVGAIADVESELEELEGVDPSTLALDAHLARGPRRGGTR